MKALFIIDNLELGGTQNLALRTMRFLQPQNIDAELVVLGNRSRTYGWQELPQSIRYLEHEVDYRKPWQVHSMTRRLRTVFWEMKPDLLHSWLWTSDYLTALANQSLGLPHVSHIVDRRTWQQSTKLKHRIRRWLTRRAFQKSGTKFLAVSLAAKEYAVQTLRLPEQRIRVAWNSIQPEQFADVRPSRFFEGTTGELVLGIASRLEPEKGHRHLLHAVAWLKNQGVNIKLLVTGQGGIRSDLERSVHELGISDFVDFVGFVDSVPAFMEQIDCFVVPSVDSEGLPTTILEAMASQRLVIATDIGGANEAIEHEKTGLLVKAGDHLELGRAIIRTVEARDLGKQLISLAHKVVSEKFSMNSMVSTVLDTYDSMVRLDVTQDWCGGKS